MSEFEICPDAKNLARAAAEHFITLATAAISARGRFTVALAGGSTPRATYALLASDEFAMCVDWQRVHVFWGDERCVPPDHPESNFRLADEALLSHVPIPSGNIHRVRGELEPEAAAQDYAATLRTFFGTTWPRFDLVLLGMGNDGHTASLFPGSAALHEKARPVVAVTAHYQDRPASRVTLTPPAINAAQQVLFLVTGAAKADIVQTVLEDPEGPYPAQRIRPTSGHLTWLVDVAAAGRLKTGMMRNSNRSPGTITFIGSGEMSATMGKVHRAVMSRIAEPVHAVFLDTPAGFQLNADEISAKAVEYFEQRFNMDLSVASFKAAAATTPVEVDDALRKLRQANYIFAGPGSPTYAIRNWQNTPILEAMAQRLAASAHLVFASAAAITVGRYALPVYEIYKVGEEPHWVEGLDLLGPYGLELVIVPHWNNAEGGTHDTRYCFMGEPRFKRLEESLPDSTTVLGIDEYTACIVNLSNDECRVMGAGQVTIRQRGHEIYHPAPTAFKLDQLRGVGLAGEQGYRPQEVSTPLQVTAEVEEALREPPADWSDQPHTLGDDMESVAPFIELIVWVRAQLRAAKKWALADEIRERLSTLGIILEDGPEETTWRED